ncbi:MAG: hypothetical protein LWW85_07115 [Marinilabiliales bacterium]|nr:hypothetical protein [Marinilabiliales bacterium]
MNKGKWLLWALVILLFAGCSDFVLICSLNPFYQQKDVVHLPAIEGKWSVRPITCKGKKEATWRNSDTASIWRFRRETQVEHLKSSTGKDSVATRLLDSYRIDFLEGGSDTVRYRFIAVFFRIDGNLFADFMPADISGLERSFFAKEGFLRVHTLARLTYDGNLPRFSWLSYDTVKEMLEKKRARLSYRWAGSSNRLLLTGTPEELTSAIHRYGNQPRYIDWDKQDARLQLKPIK